MSISTDNLRMETFFNQETGMYAGMVDVSNWIEDEMIFLGEFETEEELDNAFTLLVNDWIETEQA